MTEKKWIARIARCLNFSGERTIKSIQIRYSYDPNDKFDRLLEAMLDRIFEVLTQKLLDINDGEGIMGTPKFGIMGFTKKLLDAESPEPSPKGEASVHFALSDPTGLRLDKMVTIAVTGPQEKANQFADRLVTALTGEMGEEYHITRVFR